VPLSGMLDMTLTSFAAALASRTGKIIKNGENGENLLQNGILHFVFIFSQSSEIALQS